MKPIATPSFRKRTDGITFIAPPSANNTFKLTNTRLEEETFVHQTLYSLDQQDVAFLHRYNSYLQNQSEALNFPILAHLMTALEIGGYLEFYKQYENYQLVKQQQQQIQSQQQQQQQQSGKNTNTSSTVISSSASNTIIHQGAMERASIILSSANITGKLEEVTINVSDVIKQANFAQHPAVFDPKIQSKMLELVKAHWLERRKALGTALLPVLRPAPFGNGVFRNQQMGETDEPFTSREIRNSLVLWRPKASQAQQQQQQQRKNDDFTNVSTHSSSQKKRVDDERRRTKKLLNDALALMMGVVEREESKLNYAQMLTAELALARRIRHFPASAFAPTVNSNNNNINSSPLMEDEAIAHYHHHHHHQPLIDLCPFSETRRATTTAMNRHQQQQVSQTSTMTQKEKDIVLKMLEQKMLENEEDESNSEEE